MIAEIVIFTAVFLLVGFICSYMVFNLAMARAVFMVKKEPPEILVGDNYASVLGYIADGKKKLGAFAVTEKRIISPDGTPLVASLYGNRGEKAAILMHGLKTKPLNNFAVLANDLIGLGYDVLVPDQRAHGRSGGKYCTYGIKESEDLLAWIALTREEGYKKVIIYGVSMGGASVAYASGRITDDRVKALFIDCAFMSFGEMAKENAGTKRLPRFMYMPCVSAVVSRLAKADISGSRATDSLKAAKIPTAFIYGEKDGIVPLAAGERAYAACGAEKMFVAVKGAGHATAYILAEEAQKKAILDFAEKH